MKKEITLKHIDNQSHGYIQISKYDLDGLNIDIKDIASQYSFYNENNACYYLEEDNDANKLHTQLRLKGYGIQNTRQTGDLYVKIKATMPANISDDLLEILRQELNK